MCIYYIRQKQARITYTNQSLELGKWLFVCLKFILGKVNESISATHVTVFLFLIILKTDGKCQYYLLWEINAMISFKSTSNTMLKII